MKNVAFSSVRLINAEDGNSAVGPRMGKNSLRIPLCSRVRAVLAEAFLDRTLQITNKKAMVVTQYSREIRSRENGILCDKSRIESPR